MRKLLRIDSSSRTTASHTRALGDYFETAWKTYDANIQVVRRDLIAEPIMHITDQTIVGFYTPPEQLSAELRTATDLSDRLIAELQAADTLLLTVPMYNFTIPSALKAWIDQIVRIGHTFSYDGQHFGGLVKVQRAYITCAYGADGYTDAGAFSAYNFLQPYLHSLFSFLGITDIQFFSMQATTADADTVAQNLKLAKRAIDASIANQFKRQTQQGALT